MKRKNIILTVLFALSLGFATVNPAHAQILIMDEDDHTAPRTATYQAFPIPNVPDDHDSTNDYTPVGSGVWILGCLGAAYLLGRRRKEEK